MTSVFRTDSGRSMSLNISLALALVAGQMYAQAAAPTGPALPKGASTQVPDQPDTPDKDKANAKDEPALPNGANSEGPVAESNEKGKPPKTKHEVKRGKVKPDQFPTNPQQVVKALR